MRSAVVTGANGFVGSAVVRELVENGVEVLAVIHERDDAVRDIPGIDIVRSDRRSIASLKEHTGYEVFYDLAWEGSAGPSRADVSLQLRNAEWTVDALRVSKEMGCGRFLHAGSIVEKETVAAAVKDGNRPGMGGVYGCGKVSAHLMCMPVAAELGCDIVWPLITNAYGPGEMSPRLVNSTLRKCLAGESPRFTAGTQNYDFVYIDDVARAFRLIGENGKPFNEYLIGSSEAKPLRRFLEEMQVSVAPDLEFEFGDVPFTGTDLPLSTFDCSKTERDTGFRAEVLFGEGCRRTMEWIREGNRWYNCSISKRRASGGSSR